MAGRPHERGRGSVDPHPVRSSARVRCRDRLQWTARGSELDARRGGRAAAGRGGGDGRLRRRGGRDGGRRARGAPRPAATVIGILPGDSTRARRTRTAPTSSRPAIGQARNLAVVASGEAAIAVGGEWGTLSEIGHARSARPPGGRPAQLGPCSGAARWRAAPGRDRRRERRRGGRRGARRGAQSKSRAMISAERSEPSSRR